MPKASDTHKLLIISGSTATGKTKLAVALAKKYNGELVSADSRQVYHGLDIISGKDIQDSKGIPIWLYDVASVDQQFSVSLYRKLAVPVIDDIHARGKLPILVGGTGLYIQSIIDPPETINIPPDTDARVRWNTHSVTRLQRELNEYDRKRLPRMNQSDRNNPRRLIRALEIALWRKKHQVIKIHAHQYDRYWIGLERTVEELRKRIAARVWDRWDHGALAEERLLPMTFHATGVAPIRMFRTGKLTEEEAKQAWVREEISYAKRQMTWFRRQKDIRWYDAGKPDLMRRVEKDVAAWYTL